MSRGRSSKATSGLAVALAIAGLVLVVRGAWIPIKAQVAQVLLHMAWERAAEAPDDGQQLHRPWPWADTWPVARLQVPGLDIDQVVLEGDSGAVLAFGPGRSALGRGAAAGPDANVVIGGHRDTHFAFLRHLRAGDEVRLLGTGGSTTRYRVTETLVVDHRDTSVVGSEGASSLTLVTCWPFDTVSVGGPLRYVVLAAALPS